MLESLYKLKETKEIAAIKLRFKSLHLTAMMMNIGVGGVTTQGDVAEIVRLSEVAELPISENIETIQTIAITWILSGDTREAIKEIRKVLHVVHQATLRQQVDFYGLAIVLFTKTADIKGGVDAAKKLLEIVDKVPEEDRGPNIHGYDFGFTSNDALFCSSTTLLCGGEIDLANEVFAKAMAAPNASGAISMMRRVEHLMVVEDPKGVEIASMVITTKDKY